MRASNQVELSTEFLANKTIYEQGAVDRKERLLRSVSAILTRQILKTEQEAVTGTMSICMRYYGKIKADEEGVDINGRQE